jgi:hypothetical protein
LNEGGAMANALLMQLLTLSLYTLLIGFCFCDGFRLHILRKLLWFSVFLAISIYTFKTKNEFDLVMILPIPTILAILLCAYEKIKAKEKNK